MVEEYEKQLQDKDSNVRDLTAQIQSLGSDNAEMKKTVEELTAVNFQLQSVAQDADDAKTALEALEKTNQSLINEKTQEYSELQHQLENTKEDYERVIEGLKEVLAEKKREFDKSNAELRKDNTELQTNIEVVAEQKDVIESELLKTKSELEQVIQDSYPLIEEKDRKISELEILMEEKQRKTDESILQLQSNERTLQDRIQVLDARNSEITNQLQEVRMELLKRLKEEEGLEEDLAQANSQIDELNTQLQVATQDKQDINRLQSNFDHIMSGLRQDLQQALDGKAAADEIAHEFQVQLENLKKSMGADGNLLLEENKVTEMLEATQREVIDLKSALEVTLKERDDLQDKMKDLELSLEEKTNKEPISSLEVDLKYAERGDVEKAMEEVILQSSVDNQVTATPSSEAEVELENMKNELQKMKALNDKLKAKLRAFLKKKRVKSNSGDEDNSVRDELQAELQQVRQGKLDSEKACQQLRVELDAFVRQKESIVNELKSKIEQLLTEKGNSNTLVEHCEQQIGQKENELQEMRDDVRDLQSQNDESWKIVQELREENGNLHVQEQELIFQRTEIERECRRLKQEMEGLADDLFKRENTISNLQNQLEELTGNYKTELEATAVQHKGVIFEIQSHADQLERELLSANKEVEQLKGQLRVLKNEKEDIAKLKVNFDHIVGGLREDLQHALEDKAAADQIAHEFQVQLKRLEKVPGKVGMRFTDRAVDTFDLEGSKDVSEKLQAAQNEADNLRDALESLNREKMNLEERNRLLEEREEASNKVRKDEKDGDREKTVSEVLVQSPENETIEAVVDDNGTLLESSPVQSMFSDSENIQKVRDDLSIAQTELEKARSVNERLKAKLRTLMRKTKDAKSEGGQEGSKEEIVAELNKVRQEKLESEKAAQELRVELDAFVREKERILNELKEQIQTLLAEKEESNNLVEQFEKVLLERDAEIRSLGEQLQSLSEEKDEVNQKLAENRAENQNLKALLEQLQLQKVKAERELQQTKLQTEQLLQGQQPLLDNKDQQMAQLQTELANQRELFTQEMSRLKDSYESVISEQQNHVNNLEEALIAAHTEVEQLKSRVNTLEQGKEDISKLRTDFDHIVSGLNQDLQRALQGKATADEIAYEFQVKLKRLDQSSTSSAVERKDVCIGTEEVESLSLSVKDRDLEKLQEILEHLTEEKEELEERVMGLDEVVQDREEDLEEKGQQLQELQLEVERLTAEHANSTEKFSGEIDRIVAEGEENMRELQAHFDATLMEKATEYGKLEEQLASSQEDYARQKEQLEGELAEKRQIIDKLNDELREFRTGVQNKSDEEKLYEELQANYELLEIGNNKLRQDLYMTMKEKENLRLKLKKDYDQILTSLRLDLEQSREQNLEKERFIHNQRVEVESLVKDKDSLAAKLRESGSDVTKEKLQSSEEDQGDGHDVVSKLKNEVNWLRKECQECRMEKDKLYNRFHEVSESLRGELEKSLREKENLTQKLEETLNQNRDLQQSLIEKQSALTKAKIQFEHIGKGWRNDLDAARAERDEALRRLGEHGTQSVAIDMPVSEEDSLEIIEQLRNRLQEMEELYEAKCREGEVSLQIEEVGSPSKEFPTKYHYSSPQVSRQASSFSSQLGRFFKRGSSLSLGRPRGFRKAALAVYFVSLHLLAFMYIFQVLF